MESLWNVMRADLLKLKNTPFVYIHILVPVIGALLILLYYSVSSWTIELKTAVFFQAIAISFPLLIGIISGIVTEQEEQAGKFTNILSIGKSKPLFYCSKLIILLLFSFISIILAIGLFGIAFRHFSVFLYMKICFVLFSGNIFLYIFHLFLSFRFGKGASVIIGIVGMLITTLMVTGLGDTIWYFVPWAWAIRFCDIFMLFELQSVEPANFYYQTIYCIAIFSVTIILTFISSILWFNNWEGKNSNG